MYDQQASGRSRPAWAKRGPAGRFGGIGGTFAGNKLTETIMLGLSKSPQIMSNPKFSVPITNYMNRNKERGTPSSAVRTTAPKLYL